MGTGCRPEAMEALERQKAYKRRTKGVWVLPRGPGVKFQLQTRHQHPRGSTKDWVWSRSHGNTPGKGPSPTVRDYGDHLVRLGLAGKSLCPTNMLSMIIKAHGDTQTTMGSTQQASLFDG